MVGKHASPDAAMKYEGKADFDLGIKCKADTKIPTGIAFVFLTAAADLKGDVTCKGSLSYDPSKASPWDTNGSLGGSLGIGADVGVLIDAEVVSAEGTVGVKGTVSITGELKNDSKSFYYDGTVKTDPAKLEGTVQVKLLGDSLTAKKIDYDLFDGTSTPVTFVIMAAN